MNKKIIWDKVGNQMLDDLITDLELYCETKYSNRDWLINACERVNNEECEELILNYGTLEVEIYNGLIESFDYRPFPESEIYVSRDIYEAPVRGDNE